MVWERQSIKNIWTKGSVTQLFNQSASDGGDCDCRGSKNQVRLEKIQTEADFFFGWLP